MSAARCTLLLSATSLRLRVHNFAEQQLGKKINII